MDLLKYDTIILDLDLTVWTGIEPTFWAKLLQFPFQLVEDIIVGSDGKYIKLHEGFRDVIQKLSDANINLGFLSVGGLQYIPYESQPSVICLRLYQIHDYFKYQRTIVYRDEIKSKYFKPKGKTLFIDDNAANLLDVKEIFRDVDVLNRYDFKNWKDLL